MERTPMQRAMITDVVMGIVLSHVEVTDLLNCRKVSKFWNKAASSVLRKRSTMIKKISSKATLMELGECMRQNSDFPFAGLKFHGPWMNSPCLKQFFKNNGDKFTSLYLDASRYTRIQDLAPFVNNLPRLSILELGYKGSCHSRELLDSAAGPEDSRILLPSLRTLRISWCEMNQDFLRQIFTAASASLRVECLNAGHQILETLESIGKLQAVSVLTQLSPEEEDEEYYPGIVDQLFTTQTPALTKLDLWVDGSISQEGLIKLLISSQNTLKYLSLHGIVPSHFSSECPVLVKLTKLYVENWEQSYEYVFQGRQGHKFPALKELELDNTGDTCEVWFDNMSDGLFIVPSVTRIDLGTYVSKTGIEDLARSFPNANQILLNHGLYDYKYEYLDGREPHDIWSVGAFKFLEKLKIRDCNVKWPSQTYDNSDNPIDFKKFKIMNMDSFLTGIPITICENLRKHNQPNFADSPFHEILRDSPNILKLKNLKELIVSVDLDYFKDKWDELPEETPFMSMVSLWYALQMIPNLKARFGYDHNSLPWTFDREQRDKAVRVLKSAFKHVQPYVELEQFFR